MSTASSGTIVSTFVVSMVINLFFAGIMSLLVGMLNSMQLIVHLPIMNVAFPANVMMILRVMMPVVMFDILEYKSTILGILGIEISNLETEEDLAIPDQMQDLTYDSHRPPKVLGSLGILVLLYFAKVFLYFIFVDPLSNCSIRARRLK